MPAPAVLYQPLSAMCGTDSASVCRTDTDKASASKNDNTPLCNLVVSMLNKMNVETDSFATSSGQLSW